ncbi:single-stranded DNA-binding protein (plasmid) [Pigmentibacter ruber]
MSSVNKVILVGRLGQDPELRATTSGQNVCTLSLATSKTWTKDGKKETKTEWHRIILWGNQAENARKYLKKGRLLYIEGELQTRSWEDQQGQKRYATEILGQNIQFLESNGDKKSDNYDGYEPEFSSNSRPMDDDIPF